MQVTELSHPSFFAHLKAMPPMQVTELSHPSFFAHLKAMPGTRACHLFSPGRGDKDAVVTTGGAQTQHTPGSKSEDATTRNNWCHRHKISWIHSLPGAGRVGITNDNAQCTKCINVY